VLRVRTAPRSGGQNAERTNSERLREIKGAREGRKGRKKATKKARNKTWNV
jgi:hypothetical protein